MAKSGANSDRALLLDLYPAMEARLDSKLSAERREFWTAKWLSSGGRIYNGRLIALKNDPVWRVMTGQKKLTGKAKRWLIFFGYNVARKEAQAFGLIQLMEELDPAAFNDPAPASLTRKIAR